MRESLFLCNMLFLFYTSKIVSLLRLLTEVIIWWRSLFHDDEKKWDKKVKKLAHLLILQLVSGLHLFKTSE